MKRDVEQFLKQLLVELLALRAQCFLVTLKSAHAYYQQKIQRSKKQQEGQEPLLEEKE
jgi:hypothetical protein